MIWWAWMLCWALCSEHVLIHYLIGSSLQTVDGWKCAHFPDKTVLLLGLSWWRCWDSDPGPRCQVLASSYSSALQNILGSAGTSAGVVKPWGGLWVPFRLLSGLYMQTDACIEHLQKSAFRKKILWLRIWKHGATLKKCFFAHTFRCAWKSWRTFPCSAVPSGAGCVGSAQGTNGCEGEWRWVPPCGNKADTQRVAVTGSRCARGVLASLGSVVCNMQTKHSVRTMHGVRMGSSWRGGGGSLDSSSSQQLCWSPAVDSCPWSWQLGNGTSVYRQ